MYIKFEKEIKAKFSYEISISDMNISKLISLLSDLVTILQFLCK